jgi:uncharacterized protein YcnI
MHRLTRTLVLPAAAAAMLLVAAPAWAHVEVEGQPAPGGGVMLTFHVPNEEAPARTTSVLVALPTDHVLPGLAPLAADGWTPRVDGATVTWTGGAIAGTATEDFRIRVAALPAGVTALTFRAIQTYDDGASVAWIETSAPGAPEPEHPAPVLDVATLGSGAAAGDDHGRGSGDDRGEHGGRLTVAAAPSVAAPVAAAVAPAVAPAADPSPAGVSAPLVGGVSALAALSALGGLVVWRRRRPAAGADRADEEHSVNS